MEQTSDTGIQPAWWRAANVAPALGFSVDLMLAAIDAGQLPIRAEAFGVRGLVYVNRLDVLAYLQSLLPPEGTPA